MTFWKRIFGGGTKSPQSKPPKDQTTKTFYEKDNCGTRYDSHERVLDFWGQYRVRPPSFPYVFYNFSSKDQAMEAMLSLAPFKLASDSKKIISTDVLQYGVFDCSKAYSKPTWGFLLAGEGIKHSLFMSAIKACEDRHGTFPRVSDPPKSEAQNVDSKNNGVDDKVIFDFKQEVDIGELMRRKGCHQLVERPSKCTTRQRRRGQLLDF